MGKHILLIVAILGFGLTAAAQSAAIDSLKHVIKTSRVDTVKARTLCQLAEKWIDLGQFDSADAAVGRSLPLSGDNWKTEFDCLMVRGRLLSKSGRLDTSLSLYRRLLAAPRIRQSSYFGAEALTAKAYVHYVLGQFDSAHADYAQALKLVSVGAPNYRRGHLLAELGTVYQAQGDYSRAIELHLDALSLARKLGHKRLEMMCNGNLGTAYGYLRKNEKAESYFRKAQELARDSSDRARMLINLGGAVSAQGRYAESMPYLLQGLAIYRKLGMKLEEMYVLNNLGVNFDDQERYPEAQEYYSQALTVARQIGDTATLAVILTNVARTHLMLGQAATSRKLARESLELARRTRYGEALRAAWRENYRADSALGNWQDAFMALQQFKFIHDSLINDSKAHEIGRLEAQYEADKEKERLLARQEVERAQNRWTLGSAGLGLLLTLVIAFTLFRSRRKERQANADLRLLNEQVSQQKAEIEAQNGEIIAQRDQLEASHQKLVELDRMKEELSGMIVHDLKNPLNAVLAMAALPPDAGRMHVIRGAGQQMANLVSNLLDIQKYENAALKLQEEAVPVLELFRAAVQQTEFLAQPKNIRFDIQTSPELVVDADRELLVRVLVNLLTNAIKYAPSGDSLVLEAVHDEERGAVFRVTDHGKGIPAEQLASVFEKYSQADGGRASGRLRSTGLGLTFCRLTVEAHSGTIRALSEAGSHTTFEFSLPSARLASAEVLADAFAAMPAETPVLPEALQAAHAATLVRLRELPAYELTEILDALDELPDTPPEIKKWKAAVDAAALAADGERLKRLLG